jgi:hypothetical protein
MRYKGRKTGLRRAASMTFNNCIAGTGREQTERIHPRWVI